MSTTNIEPTNTYTFKNAYSGKMLNLYGGYTTDGTNVCQYTEDNSDEQKWTLGDDSKLYTYGSTDKCLDKYTSSSNAKNRNADIWTNSDDDNQKVTFVPTGSYVKIQLIGTSYFLTAYYGTANGGNTDARKVPGAEGNVYWATEDDVTNTNQQKWLATLVNSSSNGDNETETGTIQKLRLPINGVNVLSASRTTSYSSSYYGQYTALHYGGDIACGNRTVLKALGTGTVVGKGYNEKEGNFITVRYNNCISCNGVTPRDIAVRYFHMDEVTSNVGDIVSTSTIIGYSGNTGAWAFGNNHVHIEVDTDVNYPNHTPSLSSTTAGGGLYAGNDSTGENPFDWFYTYSGQSKSRYWDSDETWVFPEDMVDHSPY